MIKIDKDIKKKRVQEFLKFFLTGLLGASVNFLSQIPFMHLFENFGLSATPAFAWSVFLAYMLSTAVSFIPAKVWAFSSKSSGNTKREWFKFFIIATLALGVQELVSILVREEIANIYFKDTSEFLRNKASHLVGMACSFLANFFGHGFFTFRTTGLYEKLRPATNNLN